MQTAQSKTKQISATTNDSHLYLITFVIVRTVFEKSVSSVESQSLADSEFLKLNNQSTASSEFDYLRIVGANPHIEEKTVFTQFYPKFATILCTSIININDFQTFQKEDTTKNEAFAFIVICVLVLLRIHPQAIQFFLMISFPSDCSYFLRKRRYSLPHTLFLQATLDIPP